MSDVKYDTDKLASDSQNYIDKFRLRMKDVVDEIFGELYVNVIPYIETDAWTNYREALRIELEHEYKYTKFKDDWATNFRRAVFVENREEISKLIEQDILKRIKHLEDCRQEYDCFRYSPGGDRYIDLQKERDELQQQLAAEREKVRGLVEALKEISILDTSENDWTLHMSVTATEALKKFGGEGE